MHSIDSWQCCTERTAGYIGLEAVIGATLARLKPVSSDRIDWNGNRTRASVAKQPTLFR